MSPIYSASYFVKRDMHKSSRSETYKKMNPEIHEQNSLLMYTADFNIQIF